MAVDPITDFTVNSNGKEFRMEEPARFVEVRRYRISKGGEVARGH